MCSKVVTFSIHNDIYPTSNQSTGNSYCFFRDTLNQIHEQYDIFPTLNNINLWDDDKSSQMRLIHHFKCLVCKFDADHFNPWKKHILSNEHISKYLKVKKLYSYSCGACKILFYGPEDLIKQHCNDMHCDKSKLPIVSILMTKLMNHLYINSKQIYFCAHCEKFSETPLHSFIEQYSNYEPYYCKYCHITFLCSTEVLDCHSLSVEHITLKCIYLIKEAIDFNNLKKRTQVQNINITKDIKLKHIPSKLPLIILNRFQNISELMPKCKFCNNFVDWSTEKMIEHICMCTDKGNLTFNKHKTFIKMYDCRLCDFITQSFSDYKNHVISPIHLKKVHVVDEFYSYFCNICCLYMYSSKILIEKHWKTNHNKNIIELPLISHVLADNYKYVSNHPECEPIEYCDEQFDRNSNSPFYQCYPCKIDFHVSIIKFNLHKISSEHIILQYFTPKYTSQVMNNKSLNCTHQSYEKNIVNSEKHQINNGQAKQDCSKKIEAFSDITVFKTDEFLKNKVENESHSIVLSTSIDCCEFTNGCNSDYNGHNLIHQDSFPRNTITPIFNTSTTITDETLLNDIKLYEDKTSSEADEEYYGQYVTQRLRSIFDDSIKSEIKHEIDLLFNSLMTEHKK